MHKYMEYYTTTIHGKFNNIKMENYIENNLF